MFPEEVPLQTGMVKKQSSRHVILWQSDNVHGSLLLVKNKSLLMRQPCRALFGRKVDFRVKLSRIFCCNIKQQKEKWKREAKWRTQTPKDFHRNYFLISGFSTEMLIVGLYSLEFHHRWWSGMSSNGLRVLSSDFLCTCVRKPKETRE